MAALRGAAVGGLGLVTLYNLVSPSTPASGLLSLFNLPGRLAHWLISPDVPLVPDLAGVSISGVVVGPINGIPSRSPITSSGAAGSGLIPN